MKNVLDLTVIIDKLKKAGLVTEGLEKIYGDFSIKDNGHILTPVELDAWILALHQATPHENRICTDIHRWNFQFLAES